MPPLSGVLAAAHEHLRAAYPREACGVVIRVAGQVLFRPVVNAIDRYHDADPESFPRTSRDGFLLDPGELLRLLSAADRGELELLAVVHGHCDAGAELSRADLVGATLPSGEPVLPGVELWVLALAAPDGRLVDARAHTLPPAARGSRKLLQEGAEVC